MFGRQRASAEHRFIHGKNKVGIGNNNLLCLTLEKNKVHEARNKETITVLSTQLNRATHDDKIL